MLLRDWRLTQGHSLERVAADLGLEARGRARKVQRWETGENEAPAPIVAAIRLLTAGAVTPVDMHDTRMAWLRSNGLLASPSAPHFAEAS
jgi:transcriptional regulator with XRE-family HTH domain